MTTEKNVHPEVARNGRRPRWTPAEDEYLVTLIRKGIPKRDVVTNYQRKFASMERPDNGVLARIEQVRMLATQGPTTEVVKPETARPEATGTTQRAVAQICDLLEPFTPEDRHRIIIAVTSLKDVKERESAANGNVSEFPQHRASANGTSGSGTYPAVARS